MNAIGEIGNFIMIYQEPIQVAAIAMLVIGVMVCIGKAIASAGKKRKLLEEIQETVSEIHTNVKALGDKRTEVIYIDGRTTPEPRVPAPPLEIRKTTIVTGEPEPKEQEQSEEPAAEPAPAVKYFSRDCAVAKDGRRYTLEELNAQIRD